MTETSGATVGGCRVTGEDEGLRFWLCHESAAFEDARTLQEFAGVSKPVKTGCRARSGLQDRTAACKSLCMNFSTTRWTQIVSLAAIHDDPNACPETVGLAG